MSDVYLYTEAFHWLGWCKSLARKVLGRETRGPAVLFQNLCLGLSEIGVRFFVNKPHPPVGATACVLSGVKTLEWAIAQKETGVFARLLAGPNIVVSPNDAGGVLKNPAIDAVIVPSNWVAEFYGLHGLERNRLLVWASGVEVPPALAPSSKSIDFLLYCKTSDARLVAGVERGLRLRGHSFIALWYGKFVRRDYLKLLEQSRYMVYMADSESQGMAMFEAWARNVPTLHYERGYFFYQGERLDGLTATPYVVPQVGVRFADANAFYQVLEQLPQLAFSPRSYVAQDFSLAESARKFISLIAI